MNIIINKKKYKIQDCITFKERLIGYMFQKNIKECKRFKNCNSIHTFFMLENIDIVMTDKNNNIIYTKENLKPWRIILPKKNVYYTYELPKNAIKNIKQITIE